MILLGSLFWGAAGIVYSCVPAIVKELVPDSSYTDVGTYRALPAIGMVVGAAFMTAVGPRLGIRRAIVFGLPLAVAGLLALTAAFALALPARAAAASLVFVGLGGAMLLVTINATIQRFTPNSRRGRVFGVSDMSTMGAMVLATGAIGLPPFTQLDRYVPIILLLTAAALTAALSIAVRTYRDPRHPFRPAA
jgi:MFS family permease